MCVEWTSGAGCGQGGGRVLQVVQRAGYTHTRGHALPLVLEQLLNILRGSCHTMAKRCRVALSATCGGAYQALHVDRQHSSRMESYLRESSHT